MDKLVRVGAKSAHPFVGRHFECSYNSRLCVAPASMHGKVRVLCTGLSQVHRPWPLNPRKEKFRCDVKIIYNQGPGLGAVVQVCGNCSLA